MFIVANILLGKEFGRNDIKIMPFLRNSKNNYPFTTINIAFL